MFILSVHLAEKLKMKKRKTVDELVDELLLCADDLVFSDEPTFFQGRKAL